MVILKTNKTLEIGRVTLWPYCRYLVPDAIGINAVGYLKQKGVACDSSNFNSYERRFPGRGKDGESLLLYRHDAYGDQLMMTAIPMAIRRRNPGMRIDVCCQLGVREVWNGLPFEILPAPIQFESAKGYNYHLMFESMCECNSEEDQANAYDDMLAFSGIDPATVEPWEKRPQIVLTQEDFAELPDSARGAVVVQLSSANRNRSYPYAQTARLCQLLCDAGARVYLIGTEKNSAVLSEFEGINGDFVNAVNKFNSFRTAMAICSMARCVICPDSSIGHAAAAFPRVPVISLWGLFHPDDRAKYYENHHFIFPQEVCPHSPCRSHEFTLPNAKCKDATNSTPGAQEWCNVLRSISPENIVEKFLEVA